MGADVGDFWWSEITLSLYSEKPEYLGPHPQLWAECCDSYSGTMSSIYLSILFAEGKIKK